MNMKLPLGALTAGVLLAGLAAGGAAVAHDPAPTTTAEVAKDTRAETKTSRTSVQHERGIVVEATSQDESAPVWLSLYENDRHGNSVQVMIGDPEDDLIGALDQPEPFVVDGAVDVVVDIAGQPARLTGTLTETDRTRTVDPLQDAGEQLVVRGTQTQLVADLVLVYDGRSIPLAAAPAFAYDLETRRVTLYGG